MRNAKKTLSLVMIAIFTTFIVLSGLPAGAVTTAAAKAQVTKATALVVKAEAAVKVAAFNPTTAKTLNTTATKEVAKVNKLGTAYKATYLKLVARYQAVNKKIAARIVAINAAKNNVFTDAEKAVVAAEKATDGDTVDLVADATALANAQGAVTAALELIVKLDQNSANYKGLMARIDAANALIVKAMDEIAAIEAQKAKEEAEKKAAEEAAKVEAAAIEAAEKAVAAVEAAPLVTAADITAAQALGTTAATAVAAVKTTEKAAAFAARLKVVYDKGLLVLEGLKPATVASVSAVDGTITVTFNKKPLTTPAAADFVVTKAIGTAAAANVTPTAVTVVSATAVTLTVPAVAPAAADQSVVYNVTYGTGTAVAAAAYTVAKIPTLAVTSVTVINKAQIDVKFNKAVNKTTAETLANYKIGATALTTGDFAKLQADGVTVRLTMVNIAAGLTNNGKYDVTVSKNVQDANLVALGTDYIAKDVVIADSTVPSMVNVVPTGPSKMKVYFNEPVRAAGGAWSTYFTLDNGAVAVTAGDAATYAYENAVELTLGTTMTAGAHTLKLLTGMSDYAGYNVLINSTASLTYTADTNAPTATIESATGTKVKVRFSKPVINAKNANIAYRHTYNTTAYQLLGSSANVTVSTDNTLVTLDFTAMPIAPGTNTLYISYVSASGTLIKDNYSNALAAVALPISITADTTAPTVSSVTATDANTIEVVFSEEVTGALTSTNYTLQDSAGTDIAITGIALKANTTSTYVLTTGALKGGSYTFNIDGIKDTSVAKNAMTKYVSTLAVTDQYAPTVGTVVAGVSSGLYNIIVGFSESMNAEDLANVANYRLVLGGQDTALKAANCTVTVIDPKTVKLATTFASLAVGTDSIVVSGNMRDLAANVIGGFSAPKVISADTIGLVNVATSGGNATKNIKITAKDTFVVKVNKLIDTVDVSQIDVVLANLSATLYGATAAVATTNAGTVNPGLVSIVKDTTLGRTTITFVLPTGKSFGTDCAGLSDLNFKAGAFTTVLGTSNADLSATPIAAADMMAPVMLSATTVGAGDGTINRVDVNFTEPLNTSSVAFNKFTVAGYTVTGMAYANANATVQLDVEEDTAIGTGNTPDVTLVSPVIDADATNMNTLTPTADTVVTADDAAAPIVTAVAATTVAGANNDTLTITFSEPMNKTVATNVLGLTQWAVADAGSAVTFGALAAATISEDGKVLTIAMNEDVTTNNVITLDYTQDATAALRLLDANDNLLANIGTLVSGFATGAVADTTAPTVLSVAIGGTADDAVTVADTITITFSEKTTKPTLTQASFAGTGAPNYGTGATFVWNTNGDVLTITIGTAAIDLVATDTVAFTTASTVEDLAGNDFGTGNIYTVPVLGGSAW